MEFSFKAEVVLKLSHNKGMTKSEHVATNFNLDVSDNLARDQYLNKEGLPTEEGSKVLSNVLIQGLVGNIHLAHNEKFRDSAEHLRWVISELERGFVAVADVSKSEFT